MADLWVLLGGRSLIGVVLGNLVPQRFESGPRAGKTPKRHKSGQEDPKSSPREAKSGPRAKVLIFHWFYKGLAGHLPRGNSQGMSEAEPWRG